MTRTGFFWDERCFWHSGGNYALTAPVGGTVQPPATGGLPESPESKRRLLNLIRVTGLADTLTLTGAAMISRAALERVHTAAYLDTFQAASDSGGGELGLRTPFGPGSFEIAQGSASLVCGAVDAVLSGDLENAYALARPPGHHCLPDWPNGFCLMNNVAIAAEHALASGQVKRIAILDWDVHHGNGTEAIFYDRAEVLTVSIHQERNYPLDTGDLSDRGRGEGLGTNLNIPLPPGAGHAVYLAAMEQLAAPAIRAHKPDLILVACGFDASGVDPLSRMLAGSQTFAELTRQTRALAADLCDGRLVLAHEGGYSELHVPFCGHAVLEVLSDAPKVLPDPLSARISGQQPREEVTAFHLDLLRKMAAAL
ncbi:MAG: class II histone deacetylase [Pseudomonadota bacterium]